MATPLTLTATGDRATFPLGGPMPFTVTLTNTSTTAVWINARMGVGYEDGLVRELYFTVYTADGAEVPIPDAERTDVHRLPPQKEDFRPLGPGEAVSAKVDLATWFLIALAGSYQVVFTYENTWDGEDYGIEAWTGAVSAPPVAFALE